MLGSFNVIKNEKIFIKLQLLKSMKIHKVFYLNLLYKALIDLLTNQVCQPTILIIIKIEKSGIWKRFCILEIIEVNFNIRSNKLADMKIGSSIMQ